MRTIPPTPPDSTTLVLRRVFMASRQRVFRAWIEPEALQHWLRPRGMDMTVRKLEARVGGAFEFELAGGGSIAGTYLQIVPPAKLVFTWTGEAIQDQETLVTVDFLDRGPVTEVVLTHAELSTPEMRALFGGGWPSLLDALAKVLALPRTDASPIS